MEELALEGLREDAPRKSTMGLIISDDETSLPLVPASAIARSTGMTVGDMEHVIGLGHFADRKRISEIGFGITRTPSEQQIKRTRTFIPTRNTFIQTGAMTTDAILRLPPSQLKNVSPRRPLCLSSGCAAV